MYTGILIFLVEICIIYYIDDEGVSLIPRHSRSPTNIIHAINFFYPPISDKKIIAFTPVYIMFVGEREGL